MLEASKAGALVAEMHEKAHQDPFAVRIYPSPPPSWSLSPPPWLPPPSVPIFGYSGHVEIPKLIHLDKHCFFAMLGMSATPGFSVTAANWPSLTYSQEIRSRQLDWQVPDDIREVAIRYVCSLLDGGLSTPIALGDVIITSQGASGKGYECCRTKSSAMSYHFDTLADYSLRYRQLPRPVFTYMHKKGEVLPDTKAKTQVRPVIYPPFHFYVLQKVHSQQLDERMKRCSSWFSYGKSVLRSHFTDIARGLLDYEHLFKGDCTKFDSSIGPNAFNVIRDIRKRLSTPSSHDALDFIYATFASKLVQLPSTHVVEDSRQPSGQACTTTDNSLFHAFVLSGAYAMHFRATTGRLPTLGEISANLQVYLYSDDHIGATNDSLFASYAVRSSLYSKFGCDLKAADDQVGGYLSEYVYLGGRFTCHPQLDGYWVYEYDSEDLFGLLPLQCRGQSQLEILQTLASYARLVAPSEEKYNRLVQLKNALVMLPGWYADCVIPSRQSVLSDFIGLESSPHSLVVSGESGDPRDCSSAGASD